MARRLSEWDAAARPGAAAGLSRAQSPAALSFGLVGPYMAGGDGSPVAAFAEMSRPAPLMWGVRANVGALAVIK
jgi:hypothetical protein